MKYWHGLSLALSWLSFSAHADVIVNEIHYNPAVKTDLIEFIELYNSGSTAVSLDGWQVASGVQFSFPAGTTIPADGYLVVAQNPTALKARFGVNSLGPCTGLLSNQGESIELRDATGSTVDKVTYKEGFPWPTVGDLPDASIELVHPSFDNDLAGNWRRSAGAPTPGARNSMFATNLPPAIRQVVNTPDQPKSGEPVTITAKITDPDGVASVHLLYQIVDPGNYIELKDAAYQSSWTSVPMSDDGTNGDEVAGNSIYAAVLPGTMQTNRRLIRYRIVTTDKGGRSVTVPYSDDPQPNFAYFVYDGVPAWQAAIQPGSADSTKGQVQNFSADEMDRLPTYHLISKRNSVEDATWNTKYQGSEYLWWGTLVYDGKVYDHIRYRARGGVWRYAMAKNMWKFDLNRGHDFQARDNYGRKYSTTWTKINFGANIQQGDFLHRGEQGMFESLGFRLFNLVGVQAPRTHWINFRIIDDSAEALAGNQYGGDYWGLYLAVEQEDGRFLDEHALPDGNFYKMEGGTGTLNNQGLTASTNRSDLTSFMNTYQRGNPTVDWWRENFDLNEYYSYQTVVQGVHHYDTCDGKNYFYFLNPTTAQWSIHPWDMDLTWADNMYRDCDGADPFHGLVVTGGKFNLEFNNRAREIRDLLFNTDEGYKLIDEYAGIIRGTNAGPNILAADRAKWDYNPVMADPSKGYSSKAGQGRFYQFPLESARNPARKGSWEAAVAIMKDYVVERSNFLDQRIADSLIPKQPSITYVGPAGYPVNRIDLQSSNYSGSGAFAAMKWRIGEVRTAAPGVPGIYEIEPLWESAELTVFSNRVTIPAEYLKVGHTYRARVRMKDVTGRWSNWSVPVEFLAAEPDNSTALQQYIRPTEIMYNPPGGSDFEFIELQNISPNLSVPLAGATFTDGIDFTFPAGSALNPGEYGLVVKATPTNNFAAFRQLYSLADSVKIFGPYNGSLDNGGERLTLKTASAGSVIFSFVYDDTDGWPAGADGGGYSLVPREGLAPNASLDDPTSWRASITINGSPGRADTTPVQLTITTSASGAIALQFNAAPTQTYRIQYRDSLAAGTWQTLRDISSASGATEIDESPQAAPQRYFRIEVIQ